MDTPLVRLIREKNKKTERKTHLANNSNGRDNITVDSTEIKKIR